MNVDPKTVASERMRLGSRAFDMLKNILETHTDYINVTVIPDPFTIGKHQDE
jgi:hypothetical protein